MSGVVSLLATERDCGGSNFLRVAARDEGDVVMSVCVVCDVFKEDADVVVEVEQRRA